MWEPASSASGKMTAHADPSIRHWIGTSGVLRMTIAATRTHEKSHGNQKRLKILGTSLKKLDRSTSFLVAPHVMLYENRCARIACETGIDRPPKKKKLQGGGGRRRQCQSVCVCPTAAAGETGEKGSTHKNGIHMMFSQSAPRIDVSPRRYSSRVKPMLPEP